MRKLALTALAASLVAAGCATTPEPWTREEKLLFAASATLQTIDWAQTRYIASHPQTPSNPGGYYEAVNPLLPRNPTRGQVDALCVAAIAGNYLLTDRLDHKWRRRVQFGIIAVEGSMVVRNAGLGIKLEF